MKKVHPLFVIVGLTLLGAIWQIAVLILEQPHVVNFPPKGTTTVMLGDSLTVGVGASDPTHGLVAQLEKRLTTHIANKGVSGDTTRDALLRLDDILLEKPHIVIVLLGGNDYLQKIPEVETFTNLRTIIKRIQEKGAVVILVGIRGGVLADHFADAFLALSKETGTFYVPDALDGIFGDPRLMSDAVHPNDRGYEKMVDKIAPMLEGVLLSATPTSVSEERPPKAEDAPLKLK